MWVGGLFSFQFLFLSLEVCLRDEPYEDCRADDAEHAERVCAGISVGNLRYLAVGEDGCQGLIGGTKARGVGDGAIEHAYHHRQVGLV